jgi:hypothetical protein
LVGHLNEDVNADVPEAGAPDGQGEGTPKYSARVTVCRELTKIFEEVVSGSALEVKAYFETHPDKVRGEVVVIVSGK